MKTRILFLFFIFFIFSIDAEENETAKTDILFLKIQELESELAELRNKIESQNYLIEKLINESIEPNSSLDSEDIQDIAIGTDIRFKGIEDPSSKEQVYSAAIEALEAQDYDKAFALFNFFVIASLSRNSKKGIVYFLDSLDASLKLVTENSSGKV